MNWFLCSEMSQYVVNQLLHSHGFSTYIISQGWRNLKTVYLSKKALVHNKALLAYRKKYKAKIGQHNVLIIAL